MTKHQDTTGPVTVREPLSLLLMVAVIGLAAGTWWMIWGRKPAQSTTAPAATAPAPPTQRVRDSTRPRDPSRVRDPSRIRDVSRRPPRTAPEPPGDFIRWSEDVRPESMTVTEMRSGSVYLNISLFVAKDGRRLVEVWRSYRRTEPPPHVWGTLLAVSRIVSDSKLAGRYDFTPEQVAQLKAVKFELPDLAIEQRKTVTDLFLLAEAARRDYRAKVLRRERKPSLPEPKEEQQRASELEKNLMQSVAKLTVPQEQLESMDDAAQSAREIMRPDQLDLIDSGFDRNDSGFDRPGWLKRRPGGYPAMHATSHPATASRPKSSTAPATRPATAPSAPATQR